ncbi:glycosyl hydrolase [Mucilaginibacter pedocola]|uniref:Glycosyl hydrolase n=2 Tax=Mucilaginibacter pedocola TaxID=1792845 RepID=A0A1S9P8B7_9SPHI|nr:glycosyl hydrolase [Mucilaginibacter pedocola]
MLLGGAFWAPIANAQSSYELNSGWQCAPIAKVKDNGTAISSTAYSTTGWLPATVPGTVLTSLVANKQMPDPFYGMNNEQIPDIYKTGRDYYTYWFVKDFKQTATAGGQTYLNFRGVNYSFDVFLNGHKLNSTLNKGMFMRRSFNITKWLNAAGNNRLAVIVYPPDVVGNPNGGQGGDGTIAKNVGIQYTAGWDWIQPIRDRNTGIWDKVTIQTTGAVKINDPHVITLVPGVRQPEGAQAPAIIKLSAELQNATAAPVSGTLQYILDGKKVAKKVTLKANSKEEIKLDDYTLVNPKLWWPSGYGAQNLYKLKLQFVADGGKVSDEDNISVGVRQITTEWNARTESKQVNINGQKIFIKGGNWIISDEMLRFSDARYDAEVRFHRDMNLNLIRVWGGALIERPEFYEACDKYGMLVFQDMWGSGDCNGRWLDPMKLEDQWTRRKYPDDHNLYLESVKDQVKLLRNYPSLAMWCGGNEITPPEDILVALRDHIMPELDNTRWFIEYSNSENMSRNVNGGNGDGPYGIQPLSVFWNEKTFPFNSEVGSVGVSDYESLKRFIPKENMVAPVYDEQTGKNKVDPVWDYHKYIGYDWSIAKYGKVKDVEDFANKAQLVNYDQYRGLMEGFSSHMWDWYTGSIIWKTQNPWTAMRGQMYDYYLDPNACLYGLHNGSAPLHVMYNPTDGMVMVANNTFKPVTNMMLVAKMYDMAGKEKLITQVFADVTATTTKRYLSIKKDIDAFAKEDGAFVVLEILAEDKTQLSQNIYWVPNEKGEYSGLQKMDKSQLTVNAKAIKSGKIEVTLSNTNNAPVAFFNRVSVVDGGTKERILPAFYSDNYVSVLPGETKKVVVEYTPAKNAAAPQISISGWNMAEKVIAVN